MCLKQIAGDNFSYVTYKIEPSIKNQKIIDLFVYLTAPTRPGTYQGFFRLCHGPQEIEFGEKVWVNLISEEKTDNMISLSTIAKEMETAKPIDLPRQMPEVPLVKPIVEPEQNISLIDPNVDLLQQSTGQEQEDSEVVSKPNMFSVMAELKSNKLFKKAHDFLSRPENVVTHFEDKSAEKCVAAEKDPWMQIGQSFMKESI